MHELNRAPMSCERLLKLRLSMRYPTIAHILSGRAALHPGASQTPTAYILVFY